jgi:uncharacterized membrane protein
MIFRIFKRIRPLAFVFFALFMTSGRLVVPVSAQDGTVRLVFFHSPNCHYCTEVKQQQMHTWFREGLGSTKAHVLLPDSVIDRYQPFQLIKGRDVELLMVNIDTPAGDSLWGHAKKALRISSSRMKVPMIIAGKQVLVSSNTVAQKLPPLLRTGWASPGVDWPPVPELEAALARLAAADQSAAFALAPPPVNPLAYFTHAPLKAALGAALLVWLYIVLGTGVYKRFSSTGWKPRPARQPQVLLWLAAAGLAISTYLSIMHLLNTEPACGPLSGCDQVTGSRFAVLFGILPVPFLGVLGYFAMGVAVFRAVGTKSQLFWNAFQFASAGAVVFSIYLISVSVFLVQALCPWCMASALIAAELHRRGV